MKLKDLMGSGDRILLFMVPFVIVGVILAIADPAILAVGAPPTWLRVLTIAALLLGLAIWCWSAILILQNVPRGRLITRGPYAWVKHPLYTSVALLVLPALGVLLGTWLGVLLGAALYVGCRLFAPAEEEALSQAFGTSWQDYSRSVKLQWL